jgi:hypothetical protein
MTKQAQMGGEGTAPNNSATLAPESHGWLAPRPGQFTPAKDTVLTVQQAGWALRPVWTGTENCDPTGILYPDDLAHS